MQTFSFDKFFKILILVFFAYLLTLLSLITYSLENKSDYTEVGRYQSAGEGIATVVDTKTGKVYYNLGDTLSQLKSKADEYK